MTTITQVAKTMKITAKVARRRLRAAGVKKPAAGWAFKGKVPANVVAALKGAA